MNEITNRYFVFKLPIQAMSGIFNHSVEKSIESVRSSINNKTFIVKLHVGDNTNYTKYGFAEEYNHNDIITLIGTVDWTDPSVGTI